jgi:hypothetical protein
MGAGGMSEWVGGLAEWTAFDTAYISIAFTWLLPLAREHALWYKSMGYRVRAGGPATFRPSGYLADVAEIGGEIPEALIHHNPDATIASRGCPVGCWFCIVPAMEGKAFTLLPNFTPRPILCDNNLSALPAEYQEYIVERYIAAGVMLKDANSGFEPRTFDRAVYERWKPINRGPWRFAYDDMQESREVRECMSMLSDLSPKKKRVYVLIGNEPFNECMRRIEDVLLWGGEPHVQPLMKLNALTKEHWVRFDWTAKLLVDVARWANRRIWRYARFDEYRGSVKSSTAAKYDNQTGLFA